MEFKFIKHTDITNQELLDIVSLKSKQWNYTINQHLQWIDENILPDDIHVMMSSFNENLAYLNLVKIEVSINNTLLPFLGIGNVCAREKGQGYGKNLMNGVNDYIKTNNLKGILLCKNELVNFYINFDWQLIDKKTIVSPIVIETNLMIYNLTQKIENISYTGRNF